MNTRRFTREYTEYEKKLQRYYLEGFISEFSKICIFFIIFAFLGLIPEYIIALLTLISLRGNGGGLHFNHYISCLVVSFAFLYSSVLLSLYVIPAQIIVYVSMILCALIGYILVPITSTNRPPATSVQKRRSKRSTVLTILFYFILLCICPGTTYVYICYWTVILHILQLFIAYIKTRR